MQLTGNLFGTVLFALVGALVGFFSGLILGVPIAILPLRRLVERLITSRTLVVILYGLLAFGLSYLVWSRLATALYPSDV